MPCRKPTPPPPMGEEVRRLCHLAPSSPRRWWGEACPAYVRVVRGIRPERVPLGKDRRGIREGVFYRAGQVPFWEMPS